MPTILTAVLDHARATGERLCVSAISRRRGEESRTFAEVARDAGRAAGALVARGVRRGDVVVLIGTHHIDLYACWLGTVWLGAIPTILAEPSVRIDPGVYWTRLRALLDRTSARLLLTDPSIALAGESGAVAIPHETYAGLLVGEHSVPPAREHAPEDLLLLQHSSGTTGLQKGVMVSHGALMRHAAAYREVLRLGEGDVVATWLPLFHDMGMMACMLMPLLWGVPVLWLSPFEWVASPGLLLEVVSERRATHVWLPNFAFRFLAGRVRRAPGALDLSSLRAVISCSEPVTASAMRELEERFREDGLRREALQASYAMAENVFAVTQTTPEDPPRVMAIEGARWRAEHRAVPVGAGVADALELVSSGPPVPGCTVAIVDDEGKPRPACHAGRVLVRSSFLFDGYFGAEGPSPVDGDGFFDTGDLGFVDPDGHVFVTGRRKDLVIVGGRNVYPQDVEEVVTGVEGVHAGRVVCFGVAVRDLGTEGLVVLAESDLEPGAWAELSRRVRRAVPAALDLDVLDVRVVPRGELRKSTSGKLARGGNREWYLEGRFGPVPEKLVGKEDGSA